MTDPRRVPRRTVARSAPNHPLAHVSPRTPTGQIQSGAPGPMAIYPPTDPITPSQEDNDTSLTDQEEEDPEESDDAEDGDPDDEDSTNNADAAAPDNAEGEEEQEEEPISDPPSPTLREISSLASWTVSTFKPGCGVKELLSPSMTQFWQSDGPQPHLLTIHFFKVVSIVRMRIYLDQELDESYTPTRMVFFAGMGEHDFVEFAEWKKEEPRGWEEIDLDGVGGRDLGRGTGYGFGEEGEEGGRKRERGKDDGKVLRCMCVQIRVMENHQNGKDTHIRGVQLFARDERLKRVVNRVVPVYGGKGTMQDARLQQMMAEASKSDALSEPEWAREPELR